jgi:hypothetical protein
LEWHHRTVLRQLSVMRTPVALPPFSKEWSCDMQGHRFKELAPLRTRLTEEAERLRKEARGTPHGVKRDKLIRQARQAETAAHMQEWPTSAGLQAPR